MDNLTTSQASLTAGYAVVVTPRFTGFPLLGAGLGRISIGVADQGGQTGEVTAAPTFAEVLATPVVDGTLAGSYLYFNAGLGGDYAFRPTGQIDLDITIGMRAGIELAPNRTTWRLASRQVIAGPDASVGGPYLRVVLGFGHH